MFDWMSDKVKSFAGGRQKWMDVVDAFKLKYPRVEVRVSRLNGGPPGGFFVLRSPTGNYIVDLYLEYGADLPFPPRTFPGNAFMPSYLSQIKDRQDEVPVSWGVFDYDTVVGEFSNFRQFRAEVFPEDLDHVLGQEMANQTRRSRELGVDTFRKPPI